MLMSDYIKVYEQVLPDALCDAIVERFDSSIEHIEDWRLDLAEGAGGGGASAKSCLEINLNRHRADGWAELEAKIFQFMKLGISKYAHDCPGVQFPLHFGYEAIRIKKYEPARKDHFMPHIDNATLESACRFLGAFFYLRDVEVGGETIFPHCHVGVKPKKGRMLLFPPYWMYVHAGLAPVSGPKYLVSTYLHHVPGGTELVRIPEQDTLNWDGGKHA